MIDSTTEQQVKILKSDAEIKRVIACAGSGKTLVLTESIINILQNDLCRPDEILAITFTRNAAENMRQKIKEKLNKKIDFENIDIFTFNSFGNNIISENSFELGLGKNYSLINMSQSWQLLYKIVSGYRFNKIKIGKNLGKFIDYLFTYIQDLKNNLVSVTDLEKYCKEYRAVISHYMSSALQKDEAEIAEYQKELLDIYKRYEQDKKLNNFVDYNDHIFLPYQMLLSNTGLLEKYRNRYRYIFIDEFQDTDLAQGYLISLLYNPDFNKITIVGDDDQGIYSFRGACVENIINFHNWDAFKNRKVTDFYLTVNFRSGNKIVNAISNVIAGNKNRFEKTLEPEYEGKHSEVIFFAEKTHLEEAKVITSNINYLIKKGVKLKDIAILARRKRFNYILQELNRNNLKYELISGKGFFYESEVLFIISWLMAIEDIYDEIYILNIIQSPKYKISDRDVFFLKKYKSVFDNNNDDEGKDAYDYNNSNSRSSKNFKQNNHENSNESYKNISLIDGILDSERNPYLSRLCKRRLKEFITELNFYISQSHYLRLNELISLIFENSGLSRELKSRFDNKAKEKLKNIETLIRISSGFEENRIGRNLTRFITYLKDVARTDEEDPERYEISNNNSIKIMSIHAAKGLEFEVVFLPMLWKSDYSTVRTSNGKFKIPASLRKDRAIYREKPFFTNKQKFDNEIKLLNFEEERRIFYVACSRAKRMLYLSYSSYEDEKHADGENNKPKEPLSFMCDILKSAPDVRVLNKSGLEFINSNICQEYKGEITDCRVLIDRIDFGFESKHLRNFKKKNNFNSENINKAEKGLIHAISKLDVNAPDNEITGLVLRTLNPSLNINKDFKIKFEELKPLKDSKINRNLNGINNLFSLTELLDYMECAQLYKMRYIYNIPEPYSEEIIKGEKVHKYLQNITRSLKGNLIEGIYANPKKIDFDEFKNKLFDLINKEDIGIRKYIDNFLKSGLLQTEDVKSIFLEQLFYWKIKNYYISCKVDRLDIRNNNCIRIIDYKLAKYSKSHSNIKYINQLKSYICGVSNLFKIPTENIKGYLLFLVNGKELGTNFNSRQLSEFQNTILNAITGIESQAFHTGLKFKCGKKCSYKNVCSN